MPAEWKTASSTSAARWRAAATKSTRAAWREGGRFVERFPHPERVHILGKAEGFSPRHRPALAAQIRRLAPDIIHTHNLGPLIYTALAAPGAKSRILHGEHAELTPAELAPRRLFLRRLLYRRVRRVHTVSDALRDSLVRQGFPGGKISVVVEWRRRRAGSARVPG